MRRICFGTYGKTRNCVRLYPHKIEGEGHFVALLQKGNSRQNTVKENTVTVKPEIPFFKDVDYSFNNVVIKTYPGLAQAVASAVDALNMNSILGCVAGDDTIIIVTRDTEASAQISQKLLEIIKTF